jgi:multidrug efflux pump subunit AcrA (membrane-fusion protein)
MRLFRFLIASLPAFAFFGLLAAAAAIGFHFGTQHTPNHEHVGEDLYTCSMHPQVRQTGPGICPICRMGLEKIESSSEDGKVTIDPVVVQNMGVRIEHARTEALRRSVRAVGVLAEDQTRLRDVTLKFGGYLEALAADTEGMTLRAGSALFTIYSPELIVAQEELIAARKSGNADLLDAARHRLALWDLDAATIARMEGLEHAERTIQWPCPIDGVLLARDVVAGAAVAANQRILRVVDLSSLWLDAQLSESQFQAVAVGQPARVELVAHPGRSFDAEVVFVAPSIDKVTRTVLARLAMANPNGELVPGMFARVFLDGGPAESSITIDRSAVIPTGTRHVVWVARGGGRFEPRSVTLGAHGDGGRIAVLSGIADGEAVVVSGQFLIDSESRLRGGMRMLDDDGLMVDGDRIPPPPAEVVDAATQVRVDAILTSYLQVTTAFAADRDDEAGWTALRAAALALVEQAPESLQARARALSEAMALDAADLAARRAVLPKVSAAAIAIFRVARPSASFGAELHVFHCPMAPIDWVQLGPDLRNPFYGSEMLECGDATGTLPLGAGGGK